MTTSMIASSGDSSFDSGIETTRAWSGKLGKPLVLDGDITSANHSLGNDGWCWWYRKYAPGDMVLEGLESEARAGQIGVWADPQPVPPWEWRKGLLPKGTS
jgi:endonuclease YncB( thermonuclease family)